MNLRSTVDLANGTRRLPTLSIYRSLTMSDATSSGTTAPQLGASRLYQQLADEMDERSNQRLNGFLRLEELLREIDEQRNPTMGQGVMPCEARDTDDDSSISELSLLGSAIDDDDSDSPITDAESSVPTSNYVLAQATISRHRATLAANSSGPPVASTSGNDAGQCIITITSPRSGRPMYDIIIPGAEGSTDIRPPLPQDIILPSIEVDDDFDRLSGYEASSERDKKGEERTRVSQGIRKRRRTTKRAKKNRLAGFDPKAAENILSDSGSGNTSTATTRANNSPVPDLI
ncbi:hypothetical protein F4859DRAFT_119765 [Xylaria cf. heliscus]|nr:hypothetical protein F4859DRAFT_119765 [Xylaria cf. heliscus]